MPFSEIRSWSELSEVELNLWEIETIKGLSNAYLLALQEYEKETELAPFMTDDRVEFLKQRYAAQRKAMMRERYADKGD